MAAFSFLVVDCLQYGFSLLNQVIRNFNTCSGLEQIVRPSNSRLNLLKDVVAQILHVSHHYNVKENPFYYCRCNLVAEVFTSLLPQFIFV